MRVPLSSEQSVHYSSLMPILARFRWHTQEGVLTYLDETSASHGNSIHLSRGAHQHSGRPRVTRPFARVIYADALVSDSGGEEPILCDIRLNNCCRN